MQVPNGDTWIYMVGAAIATFVSTMSIFFIKNYFTSRDKHANDADDERDDLADTIGDIEKQLIKMEGDRNTADATMVGKFTKLESMLNLYVAENLKLMGKVEQNNDKLTENNGLLNHLTRQCKRIFDVILPTESAVKQLKIDIEELKTGTNPS